MSFPYHDLIRLSKATPFKKGIGSTKTHVPYEIHHKAFKAFRFSTVLQMSVFDFFFFLIRCKF